MTTMKIDISINGVPVQADSPITLQALLVARGYELKAAMACAVNNTFVPRAQWPARQLHSGDRIDVVTPITGG